MSDTQIAAGWYPDPSGDPAKQRYWDGTQWTGEPQPIGGVAVTPVQASAVPVQPVAAPAQKGGSATAALIIGIVGLVGAWIMPLLGYILGILAIVFGSRNLKTSKRGFAIAGIVLGIITLVFAVINHALSTMYILGTM